MWDVVRLLIECMYFMRMLLKKSMQCFFYIKTYNFYKSYIIYINIYLYKKLMYFIPRYIIVLFVLSKIHTERQNVVDSYCSRCCGHIEDFQSR